MPALVRDLFSDKEERRSDASLSEPSPLTEGSRSFAVDHNDAALALYGRLLQRPGNLFFSPLSIRTALGMAFAGARGETAAEMGRALRFASSDESLHTAFAEMLRSLNAAGGGAYEMAVANSLWGQDGAPLEPKFLDLIARHYSDGMHLVDFRCGTEAARVTINQWVRDKTKQKILELIPSGSLDADTRLVLVNTVYFRGLWVLQFPTAATGDEPFYLEGGGQVQAPQMYQHDQIRHLKTRAFYNARIQL